MITKFMSAVASITVLTGCGKLVKQGFEGTFGHDCIEQGYSQTTVENQTGGPLSITMYASQDAIPIELNAGERTDVRGDVHPYTHYGGDSKFMYKDAKCAPGVVKYKTTFAIGRAAAQLYRDCRTLGTDVQVIISIADQCPAGSWDDAEWSRTH